MDTAKNPNDMTERPTQPVFPVLTAGQKLAGCYLLKSEKFVSDTMAIWLAHDEVLGKDVALHFIPQTIRGDEKAMDELRHLTKRNRQLIHPNILRIYDFIEESDWAAVSTDAVEGESLAAQRRRRAGGHFEVADVKPWLSQLCQTLDDAHKIQLIHADLSPEHLFVDQAGKLLVTNFGIGRSVRDAAWRAGGANGKTPSAENLSPQMLDGQAPVASDDVYATGVLLHELLVGEPPFTGSDLAEKGRNVTASKILERRSQLQRAGGPVPPNWEKVIAACLEKTADQRPKNLADLSTRLGLSKFGGIAEEPAATASQTEPVVKESETAEAPVIPVVKRAWVGAKAAAPSIGGASVAKAVGPAAGFADTELDVTDFEDSRAEDCPTVGSRRSGFPVTGVAAAAILGGLCVYTVYFGGFGKGGQADIAPVVSTETDEKPQYAPVKNPIANRIVAALPEAKPVVVLGVENVSAPHVVVAASETVFKPAKIETPVVAATFSPKPEFDSALTLVANPKPAKAVAEPVAVPVPAPAAVGSSASVSAKSVALEATRKSVDEWDKAHATMLKKKAQAEAAIAEAKKALDEKMKAVAPMLTAADEVAALKQKREEESRAAEIAAAEAKKAAEEKARLAEEAKKAVLNVDKESKDKLAAQKKAEAELEEIKKVIGENERLAAESTKLAEGAIAKKTEQAALVKQKEQEVALAMAAVEMEVQKKREFEEKRAKIMKEMDEAKRAFDERMKALESSLRDPEKAPTDPKPATPVPATPPPAAVVPATPVPTSTVATAPVLPPADSTLLAKMEKPPGVPAVEPKADAPATVIPAVNSLGIAFVPVGDLQFAVWPTRLKDFEAFATATNLKSSLWRDPGFKQAPEHPVVNVTWLEANAFCKWLTFKEQKEGTLPAGKAYRLPTDLEWSRAVGLPEETGKTAEARDMGVPDVYPWGTAWPPPQGAGNYTGEETGSDVAIKGYSDGFPWTSPVGSFPPNKYGIYDMGGNVWQWVMDQWNTDSTSKVLRGASWYNGALKLSLLSSCRVHAAQDSSTDNYGFRCVIANESAKSAKR
ncbi:MAG: SUMF1/EgtB/PvdO family nonheme iron enzyme [Chthoniobacteraceae bacterium]